MNLSSRSSKLIDKAPASKPSQSLHHPDSPASKTGKGQGKDKAKGVFRGMGKWKGKGKGGTSRVGGGDADGDSRIDIKHGDEPGVDIKLDDAGGIDVVLDRGNRRLRQLSDVLFPHLR